MGGGKEEKRKKQYFFSLVPLSLFPPFQTLRAAVGER